MDFEQYGSQLILNHESKERTQLRICAGGVGGNRAERFQKGILIWDMWP